MIDRRLLLTALAASPLAACVTGPDTVQAGSALKLVTFNIWHDRGDWTARRPLLIEAIRAENADVIALQEVLQDAATNLPNQAETVAAALGPDYRAVFSSVDADDAPRRFGNAILTRRPIVTHDFVKLRPLEDYRTALRVRIDVEGRPVDIVTAHLAWQPDAGAVRTEQLAHMMDWIPEDGTPLVVMGDLNAQMTQPEIADFRGERFVEAFSALHPDRALTTTMNLARYEGSAMHIDHIFVETAHFTPLTAAIIGDAPTANEWPSDHFGVATRVRLKPRA
ncbi:MAG: hypothetical protein EON90_01335 [Brevundimonas sp.]|nr:MAG: hypothetical protein EON90_01335 [Brevundimonas sp.]